MKLVAEEYIIIPSIQVQAIRAMCYYRLGNTPAAIEYLRIARHGDKMFKELNSYMYSMQVDDSYLVEATQLIEGTKR